MAMGVDVLVCTPFDFGDLNILCFRIVIMLIYKTGGTWRLGVTLSNMSTSMAFQMQVSSQNKIEYEFKRTVQPFTF